MPGIPVEYTTSAPDAAAMLKDGVELLQCCLSAEVDGAAVLFVDETGARWRAIVGPVPVLEAQERLKLEELEGGEGWRVTVRHESTAGLLSAVLETEGAALAFAAERLARWHERPRQPTLADLR